MRESSLFSNPSQTSKDPRLEKTLKNLLKRYLKSEPLGAHHASLTLILIRGLVLELPCYPTLLDSHLPGLSIAS